MKTNKNTTHWLGLALACGIITFAVSASAKKPQPPPEPPPPSGPVYQLIPLEGTLLPDAISDAGILTGCGLYQPDLPGEEQCFAPFSLSPRVIGSEVQYLATDVEWLPTAEGIVGWGYVCAVNRAGLTDGYTEHYTPNRAMLWLADGTPIDLGVAPPGANSQAQAVNDAGLVAVGYAGNSTAGVVVPMDVNEDGKPDLWFTDLDGNGINDLFYRIETGSSLTPVAINEAGQVALKEGYLLTPDFSDTDGDGNPWFADANSDGVNDLLVALSAPAANITVNDLNNLGQVVGHSGGHVVRWEFIGGVEIVTDLGTLSASLAMFPKGMNDSGQIVGTSTKTVGKGSSGPSWLIKNDTLYELSVRPSGINNNGWICGSGSVAIPVEEP